MTGPRRLCHSCRFRHAEPWSSECSEFLGLEWERRKPRSFVPLFGSETRVLPNVGECIRHRRRGCQECVGENK